MEVFLTAAEGSTTISLSGTTSITDKDISIAVTEPLVGNLILLAQISPNADGSFMTDIKVGSQLWNQDGTYIVAIRQGSGPLHNFALSVEIVNGVTRATSVSESTMEVTPSLKLLSSNPRIVDAFGNTFHSLSVDQQVQITADLENQNNFDQSFVFYVTVRGTEHEVWITGSLFPGQTFSPALSWTPNAPGIYTIDITIFDDMDRRNVLAPTITTSIGVNGSVEVSGAVVSTPAGTSVPGCEVTNSCFIPNVVIIDVGEVVRWTNDDNAAHTVTSGDLGTDPEDSGSNFDSGLFLAGTSFEVTFDTAGVYPYFCMVHPWMEGTVIVQGTTSGGGTIFDAVPPLILVPSDVTVDASDSSGARVDYSVKAIDDVDGVLRPNCSPSSGSLFPIGETAVTCTATDNSGNSDKKSFVITVNAPDVLIPSWIKDVAGFWCGDEIDDGSFIEAIQYLIDNDVIIVPSTASSGSGAQEIPNWVKSNACWWSQGLITNSDFASGLQYLIGQGIIQV